MQGHTSHLHSFPTCGQSEPTYGVIVDTGAKGSHWTTERYYGESIPQAHPVHSYYISTLQEYLVFTFQDSECNGT